MEQNKITAIIQARSNSSRFKDKIFKKIEEKEVILYLISRLKRSNFVKDLIVAIPNNKKNQKLYKFLIKNNIPIFRGSEKDVLKRYYECAKKNNIKNILRITSDCPLIDFKLIDKMAKKFLRKKLDYFSNIIERSFPDGLDAEFFTFKALSKANKNAILNNDREHVTPYIIRSNKFTKSNYLNAIDYSKVRITLDYKSDLKLIKKIVKNFKNQNYFGLEELIKFYKTNKKLFEKNNKYIEKKKFKLQNNPSYIWQEANKIIASGNSLFSKRPDIYIKDKWPTYFKKAKGCIIKGIDGKNYFDASTMGVGTNILGYANKVIDNSVKKRIINGNMSSLNSIEEVELAKKLVSLHSWADKVKFTRSGGEANSVAIRLARSFTKKQKIAFCGYHGWHDWYLAANLNDSNSLDNHLLKGLNSKGVYNKLKKSIFPFEYNDFNRLKKLIKEHKDIGIIKMEVIRNVKPKNNFLKKVKKLSEEKKIVLIFDECTTGFRENLGGIHLKYKINPDICILGKALGNGYAINAIIGKKQIMDQANETFISSTFWSEASGYTAALKTLEVMEIKKSWKYITHLGKYIKKKWSEISKKHKVKILIRGIDPLPSFIFLNNNLIYKTFITQEMLKKNILSANSIYVSISHNKKNLKKYFNLLEKLFKIISKCEKGDDIYRYFDSEISRADFKRLN